MFKHTRRSLLGSVQSGPFLPMRCILKCRRPLSAVTSGIFFGSPPVLSAILSSLCLPSAMLLVLLGLRFLSFTHRYDQLVA